MKTEKTKRERYEILRSELENERQSFIGHWRELADYVLPRRPRFLLTETNRGERKNQKIIDSTATLACRTLRSGLMSGITSPARPWFRLTIEDAGLAESGAVKLWLSTVTDRMITVFLRSNLYNSLPVVYGDLGTFGTAAMMIDEDFTGDVIRTYPFPIGSYMISNDDLGRVRTFVRDFRMTVRQIIDKFGIRTESGELKFDNLSDQVKYAYENDKLETWIDVCHVITKNEEYKTNAIESKYKEFSSCYFERGNSGASDVKRGLADGKFLRESGYDYFPVLCPRWEVADGDIYGTDCPGMTAIGDVKQLQLGEKRSMQAIEKMVNPPMVGPMSLRNVKATILPADITFVDERDGQKGFRPAHEVNFRVMELEQKQDQVRARIRRAFYEDLFLMLANIDRRQITAREIDERHEEKLLALGPVLEQLNQDLLDPLIDITFEIMLNQGLIPEPPKEIQGGKVEVEYISIMAQAQKLTGIGGMERFVGMVGQIVQSTQNPSLLDKVDQDQFIDVYGDLLSVPPGVIRADQDVALIRQDRAKAQQAQALAENARNITGAAKDLSETDITKDSALREILAQANAGNLVQ